MDTLQVLIELRMSHKYTVIAFARDGYLKRIQFYFKGACYVGLRGGDQMVIMQYKPSNGPFNRMAFYKETPFVLWPDWVTPTYEIIVNTYLKDTPSGAIRMARKWPPFDSRYIKRAFDSILGPIAWNVPVFPHEAKIMDFCQIID